MLRDMHAATLRVLETRHDIACVLINPLQSSAPERRRRQRRLAGGQ